jgi:hypothetical protein
VGFGVLVDRFFLFCFDASRYHERDITLLKFLFSICNRDSVLHEIFMESS